MPKNKAKEYAIITTHGERILDFVRPEVARMAVEMENKLQKNDHKTGWKDQPIEAHIKLMKIEIMEFDVANEFLGDEEAAKECIDIANFALIIRDKLLARIEAKALQKRRDEDYEEQTRNGCSDPRNLALY